MWRWEGRTLGAESSHSNKVVIRRLSYLDLLLNGRFLLLYAKVSNGGQQKGNQRTVCQVGGLGGSRALHKVKR